MYLINRYFHIVDEREDLMITPKSNGVVNNLTFNSKKQENSQYIVAKKFSPNDDTSKGLAIGKYYNNRF